MFQLLGSSSGQRQLEMDLDMVGNGHDSHFIFNSPSKRPKIQAKPRRAGLLGSA